MTIKAGNPQRLAVARAGELAILSYLQRKYAKVQDVRNENYYQLRDIDYIAGGIAFEIKTDAKANETGNFCFELARDTGLPGCFYRSKADKWIYVVLGSGWAYQFDLARAQAWLTMHLPMVKIQTMRAHNTKGAFANYIGAMVPMTALLGDVEHERIALALD